MRSTFVLGVGFVTLLSIPAAAYAISDAAAHQLVAGNSISTWLPANASPTATPTRRPTPAASGNVAVTVPTVVFGANAGLPGALLAGRSYTAKVLVWVSPGVNDAQVTVRVGDTVVPATAIPAGSVAHLSVSFTAGGAKAAVEVDVTSATGDAAASTTYRVPVVH